ncbi:hypothetical protein M0R45_020135 [Rubus argutus]|uniref:Uncharacterized protein n=1 Tax=Rubus argutus TaxID=59490 RepID=A0AAW1X9J7_RUBAR
MVSKSILQSHLQLHKVHKKSKSPPPIQSMGAPTLHGASTKPGNHREAQSPCSAIQSPWLHLHGVTTAPIHVHHPSSNFQFTEPVSASPCFFTINHNRRRRSIHGTHQLNCSIHHTGCISRHHRSPWSSLLPHASPFHLKLRREAQPPMASHAPKFHRLLS